MYNTEQWIWLPDKLYPNELMCPQIFEGDLSQYTFVSFRRKFEFDKAIKRVKLRFSADTFVRLFCNEKFLATGPACVGGDFLQLNVPYSSYYSTEVELTGDNDIELADGVLFFHALVRMSPIKICEFSKGHGGFFLHGEVFFADGTKAYIDTDEMWMAKKETAYVSPCQYDESRVDELEVNAARIQNIWHTRTSPIPPCEETEIYPIDKEIICVERNSSKTFELEFDKIYAGYIHLFATSAAVIKLKYYETDTCVSTEEVKLVKNQEFCGVDFHSVGRIIAEITNETNSACRIKVSLRAACYPVTMQAKTETSDESLNKVLQVCAHSLKYCRQTIHLDSPKHCEPLACTGDYYIETLMTAFTFGDMRLSAFDVRRTAETLVYQDGKMFHTTYSLIWVLMLWDVYVYTGEKELLADCEEALTILLDRFNGYLGDNGLIETAPNYMFVDWLVLDGINLHHPPKALGQTCLNMFYFGALQTACLIYDKLGLNSMAKRSQDHSMSVQTAITQLLWDNEKGLFFEGLNTPTPDELIYHWMPQNVSTRYYRKHANILAAYFNIFDQKQCQDIVKKVVENPDLGEVQPYFLHFLLEAIYKNDLREQYTVKILEQWKQPIKDCAKGLPEGFYAPSDDYHFDHSHAWAGTPAYSLPQAISGIKILKEGFKEVSFSPSLLGLNYAKVEIPTPYGMIEVVLADGEAPQISVPSEITVKTNKKDI